MGVCTHESGRNIWFWDKYIVIKLLRYSQFLNESKFNIRFLIEDFKDLQWEEGLNFEIQNLLRLKDEIENLEESEGKYKFNIKIYKGPNILYLSEKTGKAENFIYDEYSQFLSDMFVGFAEDLEQEYSWIVKAGQEGRSGGWLVIETNKGSEEIFNDIESFTDDYSSLKDQYDFPLSEEEMDDLNFYLESNKSLYDLGLAEKPQIVRDLYDTCLETIKLLKGASEEWGEFLKSIKAIKKEIETSKESIIPDFESIFISTYGKDD